MRTMLKLEKEMLADLASNKGDIVSARYPEDVITEIADSHVPIYHSQLAELLADCPSLGDGPDDPGLLPHGDELTVWRILQVAIYERLNALAFEWWHDVQDQEGTVGDAAA